MRRTILSLVGLTALAGCGMQRQAPVDPAGSVPVPAAQSAPDHSPSADPGGLPAVGAEPSQRDALPEAAPSVRQASETRNAVSGGRARDERNANAAARGGLALEDMLLLGLNDRQTRRLYARVQEDLRRRDGPFVSRYENGETRLEGHYRNGVRDGKWTFFGPDGEKIWESEYRDGYLVNQEGAPDFLYGEPIEQAENSGEELPSEETPDEPAGVEAP